MAFGFIRPAARGMACALVMLLTLAASGGCATTTDRDTLLVKTGDTAISQYLPGEFERLLDSLGYAWVPVTDPVSGQPVKVASVYDEYRMRFQARDDSGVIIYVHIRQDGQSAGLRITQHGRETLDADATRRYQQLRERLEFEFGTGSVLDNRPLLTP